MFVQISMLLTVPPVANQIALTPMLDQFDLSCVTIVVIGGAPSTRTVENILFNRLSNLRLIAHG